MSNKTISNRIRCRLVHRMVIGILFGFLLMCLIFIYDFPLELVENSSADSPTILDINSSSKWAYNGHPVYIYINASDLEDSEDELTPRVQSRNNNSGNPAPVWYDTYLYPESYYGTPDNGWLQVRFEPEWNAMKGKYDFRAWIDGTDGNQSGYIYLLGKVEVISPPRNDPKITLGATEVVRGDFLYIFLNITDRIYHEWELTPEIQYLPQNGSWTDISFSNISYDFNESYWVIKFNPDYNALLGKYQFRCRIKNTADGYSDGGDWTYVAGTVEVKNNPPEAVYLRCNSKTVVRGDSIAIYFGAFDKESSEEELTPHFEYRAPGKDWEDMYLINLRYDKLNGDWKITFSPPADDDFTLGLYDFRVKYYDWDDESNMIEKMGMIQILNVKPKAEKLRTQFPYAFRLESIYIITDGEDMDHGESKLSPAFEYKAPTGDWIGYEDSGSYFIESPVYFNGQWQILFCAPANAELGKYSFRIQFSDGIDISGWTYRNDSFAMRNNNPEVNIDMGTYPESPIITFTATAFDYEDCILTWEWDFGDGSDPSTEESPTHCYIREGLYIVTVRVTDSDCGIAISSVNLRIPDHFLHMDTDHDGLPDVKEIRIGTDLSNWDTDGDGISDGQDYYPLDPKRWREPLRDYLLILLVIFVIITIVISKVIFSSHKKIKKENEKL